MRKINAIIVCFLLFFAAATAQEKKEKATVVLTPTLVYKTPAVRDIPTMKPEELKGKDKVKGERMGPKRLSLLEKKPPRPGALPLPGNPDPAAEKRSRVVNSATDGRIQNRALIDDWEGGDPQSSPPDPSGAVGPNHYVQGTNVEFNFYDRDGNLLSGPIALNAFWPGHPNLGDPIVMYDRQADRWFISEFTNAPNGLLVAVSDTPDPLGTYTSYVYSTPDSFPDYPHYSIMGDTYYCASNKSGEKAYAFNRGKMLAGDASAEMVGFNLPGMVQNGFAAPQPINAEGITPVPAGEDGIIVYYQDDAWGGVAQDHIKIWTIDPDWTTPANSTISGPVEVNTSPFDSEFVSFGGFANLEQPGTSQRIDAIQGAVMYMAQFYDFGTHHSMVFNFPVDLNSNNVSGIRWMEFRRNNYADAWTLYQESTFYDPVAPDAASAVNSVFMGGMGMDAQGNIALAYTKTGPNAPDFPSLFYTGRFSSDPLGQMTVAEELIEAGTTSVTSNDRYGDYGQLTLDPTDDLTFWYTAEYSGQPRRTRVAQFRISNGFADDLAVVNITSPTDGVLTATESITVDIRNFGTADQSNFPVNYSIDGGPTITEVYTGTVTAGNTVSHTFTVTGDFSTQGQTYSIQACTALPTDQFTSNDCFTQSVTHLFNADVGVTAIVSPTTGTGLGNETVTVTIQNFGADAQSNFPVQYTLDGGTPVVETFAGPIAPGASMSYTFAATADMSTVGTTYTLCSQTNLAGDQDPSNDALVPCASITHEICIPQSNCTFGDGVILFQLEAIDQASTCADSTNGYTDFTSISTDLEAGTTYNFNAQTGWNNGANTAEQLSLWIDFNDNGIYEASEQLISGAPFNAANTDTNFTLPIDAAAAVGPHTMRLKAIDTTGSPADINDPCADSQWGEVEDYTVNILPTCVGNGTDTDGDGEDDNCDEDDDNDGILDVDDNCPLTANDDQADDDGDGIGNVCDDSDGDGILDMNDNCPNDANPDQADVDLDGIGDVCDPVNDIIIDISDSFTPNGDGYNDTWFIDNIWLYPNAEIRVYNRWGNKVFTTTGYNNEWKGESTEGGSGTLPAGSYYYIVSLNNPSFGAYGLSEFTGWIYINY